MADFMFNKAAIEAQGNVVRQSCHVSIILQSYHANGRGFGIGGIVVQPFSRMFETYWSQVEALRAILCNFVISSWSHSIAEDSDEVGVAQSQFLHVVPCIMPEHLLLDTTARHAFSSLLGYMLKAMILLTISLSFSLRALTAFFRLTLACAITSSMSLASSPVSSTSSPSSSSSSAGLLEPSSIDLPLSAPSAEWSWEASLADCAASCWAAEA